MSGTPFLNFYFSLLDYTDVLFSLHSPLFIAEDFVVTHPHAFLIVRHYVLLLFYSRIHRIIRTNEETTLIRH